MLKRLIILGAALLPAIGSAQTGDSDFSASPPTSGTPAAAPSKAVKKTTAPSSAKPAQRSASATGEDDFVSSTAAPASPKAAASAVDSDSDFAASEPSAAATNNGGAAPARAPTPKPARRESRADEEADFVSSSAPVVSSSSAQGTEASTPAAAVDPDSDFAPSQPSAPVASKAAPARLPRTLPKGTTVSFTIDVTLGSKISMPDQTFPITLSQPVTLPDGLVIPVGVKGMGEVVHAAKGGFGGKAGELILAARYLICGATKIPLGRFRYGAAGENRTGDAFAASMLFVPAAFMVAGGEVNVPSGSAGSARTTADVQLPDAASGSCTQ